jgi:hypothetical protein
LLICVPFTTTRWTLKKVSTTLTRNLFSMSLAFPKLFHFYPEFIWDVFKEHLCHLPHQNPQRTWYRGLRSSSCNPFPQVWANTPMQWEIYDGRDWWCLPMMAVTDDAYPFKIFTNKWLFTHLFFNDMHAKSSCMMSKRYLICRCISPLFSFSRFLKMTDSKGWRFVSVKCAIIRNHEMILSYRFPPRSEPISMKWFEWDAPCFFV